MPSLRGQLENANIMVHPFIVGELALGNLQNRCSTLDLLGYLPKVVVAKDGEVMDFIKHHKIYSSDIGWVDAHLLASTLLSQCSLWTLDRSLIEVAKKLGVSFAG